MILTLPAGIDEYFAAMASPATSMELPVETVTYLLDDSTHAVAIGQKHGIRILSPEQTRELLPRYPGFGASPEWRANFEAPI